MRNCAPDQSPAKCRFWPPQRKGQGARNHQRPVHCRRGGLVRPAGYKGGIGRRQGRGEARPGGENEDRRGCRQFVPEDSPAVRLNRTRTPIDKDRRRSFRILMTIRLTGRMKRMTAGNTRRSLSCGSESGLRTGRRRCRGNSPGQAGAEGSEPLWRQGRAAKAGTVSTRHFCRFDFLCLVQDSSAGCRIILQSC